MSDDDRSSLAKALAKAKAKVKGPQLLSDRNF